MAGFDVLCRVYGMTWADFVAIAFISVLFYLVTKWGARRGWKGSGPNDHGGE